MKIVYLKIASFVLIKNTTIVHYYYYLIVGVTHYIIVPKIFTKIRQIILQVKNHNISENQFPVCYLQ